MIFLFFDIINYDLVSKKSAAFKRRKCLNIEEKLHKISKT